jgi:hypothetical protein
MQPSRHDRGALRYRHGPTLALMLAVALALPAAPASARQDEPSVVELAAMRIEAQAYEHGEGVPKDSDRAVALYCEAARLGDAEAQFSLGWMYANGRGVARDNLLAALFFGMAAEQGHEYAKKMRAFYGPTIAKQPNCMIDREPGSPPPYALDMAYGPEGEFVPANPEQKQIAEMVRKIAPQFKVSPQFALAVIRAESNFDPNARSPKNAQGLMQLIPETAARFNVKKPYDPAQNVRGGLAYLRWLLAYFEGNVPLVAAAYNAGEKAVDKYKGVPPYQETRAYVQRILRYYRRERHPFDASVTEPSRELAQIRDIKTR